jgi:hypothetical protein
MILEKWNQTSHARIMGIVNYNVGDITWTFNSARTVDLLANVAWDGSPLLTPTIETANYTINGNKMEVGNGAGGFILNGREFDLAGNLSWI